MNKVSKIFFSSLLLFFVAGVVPALAYAAWVGNSAIHVNSTWYYAGNSDVFPGTQCPSFNDADLGSFYGSFLISGLSHVRDENNIQWEDGATMQMCYKFDNSETYETLYLTIDNSSWNYPDMEFKSGGSNLNPKRIDISGLSAGQHTISIWFCSDGVYDSNNNANYVARFNKVFDGGGTENSPFTLSSTAEFESFATLVNAGSISVNDVYFKLNEDLDFPGNTGKSFTPIGTESRPFKFHFDGNGKTIKGVELVGTNYVGIFGYIDGSGTVENLKVEDCSFEGVEYVGGIAGKSEGKIAGCICNSTVTGDNSVGGIVGYLDSEASMQACLFSGQLNVGDGIEDSSVGALIGYVASSDAEAPRRNIVLTQNEEDSKDGSSLKNNYYIGDFTFNGANGDDLEENDGAVRGYVFSAKPKTEAIGEVEYSFNNGITCYENGLQYGENSFVMSFVPLYDKENNDGVLEQPNEETATVKLVGRTLYTDGYWNTLCLPFSLSSLEGTPLEDATVRTLESSAFDSETGTLTLTFTDENLTSIEAGWPYIVKWQRGDEESELLENIVDPKFSNVTISNELNNISTDKVDFMGCFNPEPFGPDPNTLYLGANNTLYYPSASMTINAFRAYFKLHLDDEDSSSQIKTFNLNFGDEEMGIQSVSADSKDFGAWYSLDGRRLNEKPAVSGIYIHNGSKAVIRY